MREEKNDLKMELIIKKEAELKILACICEINKEDH